MNQIALELPPGDSWAVGVSGGADSVALLLLLRDRPNLRLHVLHLDHQLRGDASTADAAFVGDLARRLGLPCEIALRSEIEPELADPPANPSALYRAVRLEFFRRIVTREHLAGVMVAHHADDVAETVLHRLLRGSTAAGLTGMANVSVVGDLQLARPLLHVRRDALRLMLTERGQAWREDASNQSGDYFRNRLRLLLTGHPALTDALLDMAAACRELNDWTRRAAPNLIENFPTATLAALPPILARQSARRWLIGAGAPAEKLSPAVLHRLITMASDAATPHAQKFPGRLTVRRQARRIRCDGDPSRR
jgi:tRNA(Ile)-lysidine synthase